MTLMANQKIYYIHIFTIHFHVRTVNQNTFQYLLNLAHLHQLITISTKQIPHVNAQLKYIYILMIVQTFSISNIHFVFDPILNGKSLTTEPATISHSPLRVVD